MECLKSMRVRSLFIFHKDSKFRRYCMVLAEPPEILDELEQLERQERRDQINEELNISGHSYDEGIGS